MRTGARIGVDVGEVRVGVARSDTAGVLALPVRTLRRAPDGAELAVLGGIVEEYGAIEVVVGLPLNLSGEEGEAAARARRYAGQIARRTGIPVRLVDERLTTVSAHQALRDSGRPGRRHRSVVDQVAATMILEQALAMERSTGEPAGELLEERR